MSAGTSPLFFLIVCFLVCSSDDQINISADVGQDVILPCKVPNKNINIKNIAVQWIRPDQDPDYVLFYRDGHFDPDYQHPSYQNRVDLQDKDMKDGNFSMILKNVKMEDTGTYECHVFEKGKNYPIIITLKVYLSGQTNITADLGQDVILPCKDPNINISSVVWRRPDLDPEYVLLYRGGRLDPDNQNPSYQNRVDLQDKDMKDGNASMILKNVKMEDRGIYECHVFEKGKNYPISCFTNLEVRLPGDQGGNIGDGGNNTGIIVVLVVGVILVAPVGFLIYRFRSKWLTSSPPNISII